MEKNISEISQNESDLSLNDIVITLLDSKKIIIIITLLITIIAGVIVISMPTLYKSEALIEIGKHNFGRNTQNLPNTNELIEDTPLAIRELEIIFQYKKHEYSDYPILFEAAAQRLIRVETITPSVELGQNSLTKVVSYIIDKHKKIANLNTKGSLDNLINEVASIKEELSFNESQLATIRDSELSRYNNSKLAIESKLDYLNYEIESSLESELKSNQADALYTKTKLENLNYEIKSSLLKELTLLESEIEEEGSILPSIDQKISLQERLITEEEENLRLLKASPELFLKRASESPTLQQLIYSYKNEVLEYKAEKTSIKTRIKLLNNSMAKIQEALKNDNTSFQISQNNSQVFSAAGYLIREKNNLESELNLLNDSINEINILLNGGNASILASSFNARSFSNSNFLLREKNALESDLETINKSISEINTVIENNLLTNMPNMPIPYDDLVNSVFSLASQLTLKKQKEKLLLETLNTQQTELIGEIETNMIPPKYILILIGFILGIILSILIVFFISFFNNLKRINN